MNELRRAPHAQPADLPLGDGGCRMTAVMIRIPNGALAATRKTAIKHTPPGTYRVVKVCGGYMAFATVKDYETWQAQQ